MGARWPGGVRPAGQRLAPRTCGWWGRARGTGLTEGWVLLCLGYVCCRCFLLVVWGWYREAAHKQPRAGLYLDAISRKGVPGAGRTQPGRSHPWVQVSHLPSQQRGLGRAILQAACPNPVHCPWFWAQLSLSASGIQGLSRAGSRSTAGVCPTSKSCLLGCAILSS